MVGLILGITSLVVVISTWRFWLKRAFRQSLPDNIVGFILAMVIGLGMAIAAFLQGVGIVGGVAAGFAAIASIFFLLATAAGKQKTGAPKIIVGQPLPVFNALTEDGATFSSEELDGTPYLLKFFRGHW
jgi:hypothetical protein